MPLTPTFQSAFQSAYRSGFTHNAGVFNSKRLDLSTNHDSSDTTISDRSPYGNDATLKSGVYFSTNGLTDKGINADCSAAGSGTYKLTGKVRSASTGTKYVTMDGATGDTLTVNTADVWEDFESTEFTGTPSNVVMGWDGGSNFSACDWSDIRLIDISDGSTVAHWQGNDSGASDLNGKLVADSSGNGYHGAHIDCAGGSGEGMDPVLAGLPGELLWFDGVDDVIDTGSNCGMNVQQFTYFFDLVPAGTNTNFARILANENSGDGIAIGVTNDTDLNLYDTSTVIVNDFFEGYTRIRFAITRNGGGFTWRVCKNGTFLTNPVGGAATLDFGANNLTFFARPNGTIEWKGLPIESAAYSTILSDATIEALTAGTLAPDEVGETPKVHYRFNVQPALPDLSGNDNTGTVNGQPITLATKRQTILQTAGQNANVRLWYNGTDTSLDYGSPLFPATADFDETFWVYIGLSAAPASNHLYVIEQAASATSFIGVALTSTGRIALVGGSGSATDIIYTSATPYYQTLVKIRITKTSGTLEMYLNDVSIGTYNTAYSIQQVNTKWGTSSFLSGNRHMVGLIYGDNVSGTQSGSFEDHYIPQLATDPSLDATGNPITNPRPNNKVINLIADDAKATVAADASMDVTKTIEGWVYYDGTDQTFLDIGTPIINSSSDVLGSTLAGSLTYYVNGVATTALGSAGWKYIVIASDTAQATDAIDILATSAAWKFIDRTLSAAEVLARFNTTKAQYGF